PRRRRGDDDVCGVGGDSLCSVGGDGITEIDMLRRIGGGEHDRSAEWSSSCSNREGAIIADSADLPAGTVAHPRVLGTKSPIVATCDDRVPNPCQRTVSQTNFAIRLEGAVEDEVGAGTVVQCGDGLIGL